MTQNRSKLLTLDTSESADLVVLTDSSCEKPFTKNITVRMRNKTGQWSVPDLQGEYLGRIRIFRGLVEKHVNDLALNF